MKFWELMSNIAAVAAMTIVAYFSFILLYGITG